MGSSTTSPPDCEEQEEEHDEEEEEEEEEEALMDVAGYFGAVLRIRRRFRFAVVRVREDLD